jgi:hypothetical protein
MDKSAHIAAEFKPAKSGTFTLGSLLVAAIIMVWGVSYIAEAKYLAGFLLFVPGSCFAIASYRLGFRSSKDQDLEGGTPFHVSATESSYQISADPRTGQEILLSLISAAASVMKDRKPLPEPSGMVATDGTADASRVIEAHQVVATINQSLVNDEKALDSALTVRQELDQSVIENALKTHPPTLQSRGS